MSYVDHTATVEMYSMEVDDDGNTDYLDGAFDTAPPRDEGFGISHAGGEYEVFNGLVEQVAEWSTV